MIQFNAHQLHPSDFMSIPVLNADGTVTQAEYDTKFIEFEDIVVNGYHQAAPAIKAIIDDLVAGKEWHGHKPSSISIAVSSQLNSITPLNIAHKRG